MSALLACLAAISYARGQDGDKTVSVFAAASLKDAFTNIARKFEATHKGSRVALTLAGSQTLSTQISQGAPADVFASASLKDLQLANPDPKSIRIFAFNHLTIVARLGLDGIRTSKDLVKVPRLVIADESVPAGHYAGEFLAKAAKVYGDGWLGSVQSHIVSRELDVRAVLAKVRLGEADAGIVYASDAVSANGQVRVVPIPESQNVLAKYPVGLIPNSANAEGGKEFTKFLFEPSAQIELNRQGFVSPITAPHKIVLFVNATEKLLPVPFPKGLPIVSLKVIGPGGKGEIVQGVPLAAALGSLGETVTFVAADDYAKSFKSTDLGSDKAVLVREADGNYQVVVAGFKPNWWVKWIRRIEIK
jgi:molybdate transport system substrate-binding protein